MLNTFYYTGMSSADAFHSTTFKDRILSNRLQVFNLETPEAFPSAPIITISVQTLHNFYDKTSGSTQTIANIKLAAMFTW